MTGLPTDPTPLPPPVVVPETPPVSPAPDPTAVDGSAWNNGAEHFKDPADAVKSWKSAQQMVNDKDAKIKELEARLGEAPDQPKSDPEGGDPTSPDSQPGDADGKPDDSDPQYVDWDNFDQTYRQEDGSIKPEVYDTLEAHHKIPRELIDTYFSMLAERQAGNQQKALDLVGGEENYSKLLSFAREHAPSAIDLLNSPDSWEVTLLGLHAAAEKRGVYGAPPAAASQEPSEAPGTGSTSMSEAPMSIEEFAAATQDPRYNSDPNFYTNVNRRYAAGKR